jgi:hypothetical protein
MQQKCRQIYFAVVSLPRQECPVVYSLLCFTFSFLSVPSPLLFDRGLTASRGGHVGMLLSPEDALQQGGVPLHKLVKHAL